MFIVRNSEALHIKARLLLVELRNGYRDEAIVA